MKQHFSPVKVNQLILGLALAAVSIVFFIELVPYMSGFLAAIALYAILKDFQRKLEARRWNKNVVATMLMTVSTIIILVPLGLIGFMLTSKIKQAIANKEEIISYAQNTLSSVEAKVGINLTKNIDTEQITNNLTSVLSGAANSGLSYFIILGIMYFVLYFMLTQRAAWQKACFAYLPFEKKNVRRIGQESLLLIKSNAIGIPLVALLQGLVALVGFFIFRVENPFFWFVITAIGSMIPFIGTAVGIVPATIILLSQDQTGMAIGFLIYGIVVIGSTDNLFRLIVQRKLANMHPLETLLGVLIGVPLFGFMGLIFGPVILSLFLLGMRLYKEEYVLKYATKIEHV